MNVNVNVKKKKPGRKRRLTGWTLIALGLLVAGVWATSPNELMVFTNRVMGMRLNSDTISLVWILVLLLCCVGSVTLNAGLTAKRATIKGICAECGYSLAGLGADAPCPECGKGKGTN